jgi:hypothetical protein
VRLRKSVWKKCLAPNCGGLATWTAVSNSTFGNEDSIFSIAYGGGKFVADGFGMMAYSNTQEERVNGKKAVVYRDYGKVRRVAAPDYIWRIL